MTSLFGPSSGAAAGASGRTSAPSPLGLHVQSNDTTTGAGTTPSRDSLFSTRTTTATGPSRPNTSSCFISFASGTPHGTNPSSTTTPSPRAPLFGSGTTATMTTSTTPPAGVAGVTTSLFGVGNAHANSNVFTPNPKQTVSSNPMAAAPSSCNLAVPPSRTQESHLRLLSGSAIEIKVGADKEQRSWTLSKAIISHYSPFLKAACTGDFKERNENLIALPDDDTDAFELFVQWMYYGGYVVPYSTQININDRCWVLGDKLLCKSSTNLAMTRMYHSVTIKPADMQYVCDNTATSSKLWQYYVDFFVDHFNQPLRVLGDLESWDWLLLNHSKVRLRLLSHMRVPTKELKKVEAYMQLGPSAEETPEKR